MPAISSNQMTPPPYKDFHFDVKIYAHNLSVLVIKKVQL